MDSMRKYLRRLTRAGCVFLMASLLHSAPALAQADPAAGAPPRAVLDSTARLLAGLAPSHPPHADLARSKAWRKHSAALQAAWTRVRERQFVPMVGWRETAIGAGCPVGKTLLYPFSGPDFLNAYWLFPDCETFVLFGLESTGEAPEVESLNERQFERLLADVRGATVDLFARNYFITGKMSKQLRTSELHGVVPMLMVSMALAGVEIVDVKPLHVARAPGADATPHEGAEPRARRALKGVTVEFRRPGAPAVRRLNYFSADATNAGLAHYPEFLDYLRGLGPTTTMLKAASYLLHGEQFGKMRDVVLDVSAFLVQDDSGLPYAALLKRGWQVRLYGRYEIPIPPFEYAYQPALARAYREQAPARLPFFFGYLRDPSDNRSTLMVGRLAAEKARDSSAHPARAMLEARAER